MTGKMGQLRDPRRLRHTGPGTHRHQRRPNLPHSTRHTGRARHPDTVGGLISCPHQVPGIDVYAQFMLDDAAWAEFLALLDRPIAYKPRLEKLFASESIFE